MASLMGALMSLLVVSSVGQSVPAFSPAVITGSSQNYSIALSGYNFGSGLCSGSGDCQYFRIGDATCNKTNPGECEAGYLNDGDTVNFNSWMDNQIQVSGYTVGQPGDAIEIGVWTNSQNQADATVWAGNILPLKDGTPQIYSVVFSGTSGENLNITIHGTGFGSAPPNVPCNNCDTAFLRFGDYAYHSFTGSCGVCFEAGFTGSSITMNYTKWNNTKIEISGLAGTYGQGNMVVRFGDPVAIDVFSTNGSGDLATAWSGPLQ